MAGEGVCGGFTGSLGESCATPAQEAQCLGHLPGICIVLSLTCSKSVT